jgi:hypothetical protein
MSWLVRWFFYKFGADTQVCPYGLRLNNFVVIISKSGRDRSRMTRINTDKNNILIAFLIRVEQLNPRSISFYLIQSGVPGHNNSSICLDKKYCLLTKEKRTGEYHEGFLYNFR